MRLVQIKSRDCRRIALVEEPMLRLIQGFASVVELAEESIRTERPLSQLVTSNLSLETLPYDEVYNADPLTEPVWQLLPPIDNPKEPARCLLSGTGLTHLGSARSRSSMHEVDGAALTDSMKMFQLGVAHGKPNATQVGIAPEWFYKGNGRTLRAHGEALSMPAFSDDGGEEAEIAACYLIGPDGVPHRIGMAAANEFSDHIFEKKNYLNLAGSKLRECSIGPEIAIDPDFRSVAGNVTLYRGGAVLWSHAVQTGEDEMCHSLANIEYHHFKFANHRHPGDVHIHFLGADLLSFGEGVRLQSGDLMEVRFDGFGRALHNSVIDERSPHRLDVGVKALR